jgi:hypothetical protein
MAAAFEGASLLGECLEQGGANGLIASVVGEMSAGGSDRGDSQSGPDEDREEQGVMRGIGAYEDGSEALGREFSNLTRTHTWRRDRFLRTHGFRP